MKRKGLTLIELMVSISILLIIITICSNILINGLITFHSISQNVNASQELKIAMDFICDTMEKGSMISIGTAKVTVDSDTIYLKNNILRFDQDQQQIACNIDSFVVEKVKENELYRISLSSGNDTRSRILSKGN